MILAIDIGNTNIVIGGYVGKSLFFTTRLATDRYREADQYAAELQGVLALHKAEKEPIEGAILSSVVPNLTPVLQKALSYFTPSQPMLLSLSHAGRLKVDIENPAELGMDLLASAIAACHLYPLPAIILDMGTATKILAVDENCVLRGVSIAPGLMVSLDALLGHASLLSGVVLSGAAPKAIGRNSAESIQSGLLLGTAFSVDGMIDAMSKELGGVASILGTGGAMGMILPYCRHPIQHVPSLIMDGLLAAYLGYGSGSR